MTEKRIEKSTPVRGGLGNVPVDEWPAGVATEERKEVEAKLRKTSKRNPGSRKPGTEQTKAEHDAQTR